MRILAHENDIDVAAELERLSEVDCGGIATFTGIVRRDNGIQALRLEAYPEMAQRALESIAAEARRRWNLSGVTLIHRYGTIAVGGRIVFVGTAAPHRAAALESCAFLMDWTKTRAPFWKEELYPDGRREWVDARYEDERAAAAWE